MNRTRLFVALLAVLFVSAVGVGVLVGDEDPPDRLVAASEVTATTTTVPRPTTTRPRPTTTTTSPTTTTTLAPIATTAAPRSTTSVPRTTLPVTTATTAPPATTIPPTTTPPPTAPPFDNAFCSAINAEYIAADNYDDPSRIRRLQEANCPPRYF